MGPLTRLGVWSLTCERHLVIAGCPLCITEGFAQLFLLARTLRSVEPMWSVIVALIMLLCTVIGFYIIWDLRLRWWWSLTRPHLRYIKMEKRLRWMRGCWVVGMFFLCSESSFLFFRAESLACPVCWINIDLPFAIKQMTDQEIGWRLKVFRPDSDWLSLLRKYRWWIDLRCCRRWILKTREKKKKNASRKWFPWCSLT